MHTSRSLHTPSVLAALLFVCATAIACAGRPVAQTPQPEPVSVETARISEALDQLEERLLASQGAVSMWDELRDRHETVSAVTCTNLSEHVGAMTTYAAAQRDKRKSTKNRLASRTVVSESSTR